MSFGSDGWLVLLLVTMVAVGISSKPPEHHSSCLTDSSPKCRSAALAWATSSGLRPSMRSPASAMMFSNISTSSRTPVSRSMISAVDSTKDASRSICLAARSAPSVVFAFLGAGVIGEMLRFSGSDCNRVEILAQPKCYKSKQKRPWRPRIVIHRAVHFSFEHVLQEKHANRIARSHPQALPQSGRGSRLTGFHAHTRGARVRLHCLRRSGSRRSRRSHALSEELRGMPRFRRLARPEPPGAETAFAGTYPAGARERHHDDDGSAPHRA